MTQRRRTRRAVGALEHRRQLQRLHPGRDKTGTGQDGENTRHLLRSGRVNRDDPGVCMRGAQEGDTGLAGKGKIVGKVAGTGQQTGVLDSPHFAATAKTADRR
jgi:hypothetical protein